MSADGSSPVVGPLTRELTSVVNSFNRLGNTTPYDIGDAIADNATAGSVTLLQWTPYWGCGTIRRVKVRKSNQAVATPTIRVWLFKASLVPGAADNAAFVKPLANCIGFVDVDVTAAGSDDAAGWTNCDIPFEAATIYGLLETRSVFTPASEETFRVDLTGYPG